MIVVDTNVIAYFLVEGPYTAWAEALYLNEPDWVAPKLWRSEMRNLLMGHVRRGDFSLEHACDLQAQAEQMMAGRDHDVASDAVLTLAQNSGSSSYDCEFIALSLDLGIPFYTADRRLQRAFPATTRLLSG